jgi:hypothetical protein
VVRIGRHGMGHLCQSDGWSREERLLNGEASQFQPTRPQFLTGLRRGFWHIGTFLLLQVAAASNPAPRRLHSDVINTTFSVFKHALALAQASQHSRSCFRKSFVGHGCT